MVDSWIKDPSTAPEGWGDDSGKEYDYPANWPAGVEAADYVRAEHDKFAKAALAPIEEEEEPQVDVAATRMGALLGL